MRTPIYTHTHTYLYIYMYVIHMHIRKGLSKLRDRIEDKGFKGVSETCGAFVTFEHILAAQTLCQLLAPTALGWVKQPKHMRICICVGGSSSPSTCAYVYV